MSLIELFTRQEQDATKVSISPAGQVIVDFADVMKTPQFRKDLDALRELAVNAATVR